MLKVPFLLSIYVLFCTFIMSAHGGERHAEDIVSVLGLSNKKEVKGEWAGSISSYDIDGYEEFLNRLKTNHKGFTISFGDHRLLFHWGYNDEPWSLDLEKRVRKYCEDYDLNVESNIRIFKSEMRAAHFDKKKSARNRTLRIFGFNSGGTDGAWADFFTSMAYSIHLLGDYSNTNLEGLPPLSKIIGLLEDDLRTLDARESRQIIRGLKIIEKRKYSENDRANIQKKADAFMDFLKSTMPIFMHRACNGRIYNRLKKRGIYQ